MKILVIGTGYVGLVAGTCFAETGNDVTCGDVDEKKIELLKQGESPIYEPGLTTLIERNVSEQRLCFTTDIARAIKIAEVIFIAVGTPAGEDGTADLKHVLAVAQSIGKHIDGYKIIVNKSTVPVGTARQVREVISAITQQKFDVVSNPEFLKEGNAINDFLKPDRVIIGTDSDKAWEVMKGLYDPYVRNFHPVIRMEVESAEVSKYACNAMLALRISFVNEMARLCDKVGANFRDVRLALASDKRIGEQFLYAGIGYGGSCFPKDVKAIIAKAREHDLPFSLMQEVENINERQKLYLVNKIEKRFGKDLSGLSFAIWGLAFKPKTDDIREAPALAIIDALIKRGAGKIIAHDPVAIDETKKILADKINYSSSLYDALDQVDALILCTEWSEYYKVDLPRMKKLMKQAILFDGRNLWAKDAKRQGFEWHGVGIQT